MYRWFYSNNNPQIRYAADSYGGFYLNICVYLRWLHKDETCRCIAYKNCI
jgi:hypothetical protein